MLTGSSNSVMTVGQAHKRNSDLVIEATWDNDIQSKVCYIYDYFHDDYFTGRYNDKSGHIDEKSFYTKNSFTTEDYVDTHKTRIEAKFIVTQYNTLSKDQVEFHIMFKPSQKLTFGDDDDLYYYEKDFVQRYGAKFPIGLYIDVPDDKGIYHKWLICSSERANQFVKYSILPCDYYLQWIEQDGAKRLKRQMWCVLRSQNS